MTGAVEVIHNLILGGEEDLPDFLGMNPQVLVPLNRLSGKIWNYGFRGEILYCPITDGGVLPDDVLENLVEKILERMDNCQRVVIFCAGGLGRTGYVAACVLWRWGKKTPIEFLRANYRYTAVETVEQIKAVLRYCSKHPFGDKQEGASGKQNEV
jgi:protein-tyrosine phosphatase